MSKCYYFIDPDKCCVSEGGEKGCSSSGDVCNCDRVKEKELMKIKLKHGKWLVTEAYPHRVYCSECHTFYIPNIEMLEHYELPIAHCPNCGLPMMCGDLAKYLI